MQVIKTKDVSAVADTWRARRSRHSVCHLDSENQEEKDFVTRSKT